MKNYLEIREEVKKLWKRRLSRRKKDYLSCRYINCTHNRRFRVKGVGTVGYCQHSGKLETERANVFVCNDDETAKNCPYYLCLHTPHSVEFEFRSILRNPAECGRQYPKLASLLWVLQGHRRATSFGRLKEYLKNIVKNFVSILTFRWV